MTIKGIERETAEILVKGGFHSLEGLLAADLNDLTDILGAEKAAAAQQAANAEQERREAASPRRVNRSVMSIRVHELAKRCGLSNKDMIEKLHAMNYPVKSTRALSTRSLRVDREGIRLRRAATTRPRSARLPCPNTCDYCDEKTDGAATVAAVPAPGPVTEPLKAAPETPQPTPAKIAATPTAFQASAPAPAVVPKPAPVAPPSRPALTPQPTVKITTAQRPVAPPAPAPRPTSHAPATPTQPAFIVDEKGNKVVQMKPPVIVRDFAQRIGIKSHVLLAELMTMNVFANPSESIGEDIARKICERHGFLFELENANAAPARFTPHPRRLNRLKWESKPPT